MEAENKMRDGQRDPKEVSREAKDAKEGLP
jgi:hypothetical protein